MFSLPWVTWLTVEGARPCQRPPLPLPWFINKRCQDLWLWSLVHLPKDRGAHNFFPSVSGPPPSSLCPQITHKHTFFLCGFHMPIHPQLPTHPTFFSIPPPLLPILHSLKTPWTGSPFKRHVYLCVHTGTNGLHAQVTHCNHT